MPVNQDFHSELLVAFEKNWKDIHSTGVANGFAVKKLESIVLDVKKKYMAFNNGFSRLASHLNYLPSILAELEVITETIGQLEGSFNDLEELLKLLESSHSEDDAVGKILRRNEKIHNLKLRKQKEIEELKVILAKEHSEFLEKIEKDRNERKRSTEEALRVALWKIDHDENKSSLDSQLVEQSE